MRSIIILTMLGFTATLHAGGAVADIVARYAMGKETLVLSYRDDQHIRVDRGQLGYSIINGDQAIAVLQQGGARVVMSVDQIGDIINGSQQGQAAHIPDSTAVSLRPTGQFSDVAGIKGRVYTASDGRAEFLAVLTDHKDVAKASDGLRHFFRRFASSMKNERGNKLLALEDAFKGQADSGVLQIEGGFKLLSIGHKTQSQDFYTPPPIGIQFPGQ
ncbi:hypothetical protein [Zhongshania arctica]|uniref:DUF4412 domain-containing protein n=1 Tax=Zhongshania arctica TaxID=3238302 RepID=A0ABV3TR44_9GAMM|tara:strand:+ start:1331 stop:1978 length:648 start_codon:yes stop_codon:yes gene_type:complete